MVRVVHETDTNTEDGAAIEVVGAGPDLDELCRLAAKELIAVALETVRRASLDAHADGTDASGRWLVVGNGYLPERTITTGAGQVEVTTPRVADKRPHEQREPFSSSILPRYMRKSPKVTEVLYLRGLPASTVNRLTEGGPLPWHATARSSSRYGPTPMTGTLGRIASSRPANQPTPHRDSPPDPHHQWGSCGLCTMRVCLPTDET